MKVKKTNDPEHSPALPTFHKMSHRLINAPRLVHDSFGITVAEMQHPFYEDCLDIFVWTLC